MGDAWDAWVGIGTLISGVAAVGALVVAIIALCLTKGQKELAKKANQTSAKALTESRLARTAAEKANEIAEDANTIARGAANGALDHTRYEWKIQRDIEGFPVAVVNPSPWPARNVTATVMDDRQVKGKVYMDELGPAGKVDLDLGDAPDRLRAELANAPHKFLGYMDGPMHATHSEERTFAVEVWVEFTTESGVRRSESIPYRVRLIRTEAGATRPSRDQE